MSTTLTTLGLRAASGQQPPNHAAGYLVANFVLAYALLSTRGGKIRHGLDHNVSPREDLSKYGEAAVQAGKLSRTTLNRLKRQEAAHANAVEGFPFFVAGILLAVQAGVPSETINIIGAWYTLSRVAYGLAYVFIESETLSFIRSLLWWSGNSACITALVFAGKRL